MMYVPPCLLLTIHECNKIDRNFICRAYSPLTEGTQLISYAL